MLSFTEKKDAPAPVPLQCRQHFQELSFSGSRTAGPFLPKTISSNGFKQQPYADDSLNWLFNPDPSSVLQASSSHIMLHISHLHLEISQALTLVSKCTLPLSVAYLIWWYGDPDRHPRQSRGSSLTHFSLSSPFNYFLNPAYFSLFVLLNSVSSIPTRTDLVQALHISPFIITFQLVRKASSFIALKSISYTVAEITFLGYKSDHLTPLLKTV